MKFPAGTRVYYLEVDEHGRKTRTRPAERLVGTVVGERDARGARVRWRDGFVGSVLWDWIAAGPPQPEKPRLTR